jgi:hypothetical protein
MRLDGMLDLSSSSVDSTINLVQAKISGLLSLREAIAGTGTGAVSVSADGLAVDGDADLAELTARGTIALLGVQVSATADLTRVQVTGPQERELILSHAKIGGQLRCGGIATEGEIRLHNARIEASPIMAGRSCRLLAWWR